MNFRNSYRNIQKAAITSMRPFFEFTPEARIFAHRSINASLAGRTPGRIADTVKPASRKSIGIQTRSRFRRRSFVLFTIFFPFIFFLVIELLLRLLDYGPDVS